MNPSEQIVCCVLILISLAVGNLYGKSDVKPRFGSIDVLVFVVFILSMAASAIVLIFQVGCMVGANWGSK